MPFSLSAAHALEPAKEPERPADAAPGEDAASGGTAPQLERSWPKGPGLGPGRLAAEAAALVAMRRSAASGPRSVCPSGPAATHAAGPAGDTDMGGEMAPGRLPPAASASAAGLGASDDPGDEPAAAADDDASDEWHEADDSGPPAQLAESQIWHEADESRQSTMMPPSQSAAAEKALPVQSQAWHDAAAEAARGMPGVASERHAEAHAHAGESHTWHGVAAPGGSRAWQEPGGAAQALPLRAAATVRGGVKDREAGQGPGADPDPDPAAENSFGNKAEAAGQRVDADPGPEPERRAGRESHGAIVVAADDEDEDAASGVPT